MVYGCDGAWWRHREGLPEFAGLKVCYGGNGTDYTDILKADIRKVGKAFSDDLQFEIGVVGGGGNSGFQALNLAVQFGGNPVILIGFDMQGTHWYGRNGWSGAYNPMSHNFKRWIDAFELAAVVLKAKGVSVVNASPMSAMNCFQKVALQQFLGDFHYGSGKPPRATKPPSQ